MTLRAALKWEMTSDGWPAGLLITLRRQRDDIALRLARILETVAPRPRFAAGWE